ncbi:DUF3422 family protein [Roseibium polysiphoniae]|uniref:DUF3422 domain-containing protein n=1 Tax=Roseibium polysiphoniae TaxID=2571221 RepID=A0ABR9CGG7_9HYPH|nr:DUF3422 domain-containing protein [Roseibium polysiphoniae]MBD8878091.1 DUF3422 domain-containing protein [Roseibium polysiphoniae]
MAKDKNEDQDAPSDRSAPAPLERAPSFPTHPLRESVLGEVHARPFRPVCSPRVVLHYAFATSAEEANRDRSWFSDFCASQGAAGPAPDARYHVLPFAGGALSWERHTEFTTYTWDGPATSEGSFAPLPANNPFGSAFRAPGLVLVATRLDLLEATPDENWRRHYDPASLTVFNVEGRAALAATDFRPDGNGLTRFLVLNESMNEVQCGAVVQRLLEIETYRTFALLGLFEANKLQPEISAIETDLVDLSHRMQASADLEANKGLLEQLSRLAASLEAGAASSSYRFGAGRAYYDIVVARLKALGEEPVVGDLSMSAFLGRRLAPAMRTCQAIEERQATLSRKLARATTLLRTRVDVDLEQQNRSLLESMNRRARLQLRLQQTVEGLSVAAVSYYVVGLLSYLAKGAKDLGLPVPAPAVTIGLAVPVVVLTIWWTVRKIRAHHAEKSEDNPD